MTEQTQQTPEQSCCPHIPNATLPCHIYRDSSPATHELARAHKEDPLIVLPEDGLPDTMGPCGPPSIAHDPIEHPAHYTSSPAKCRGCGRTIECIDVTRHMSFPIGNVVKYLWRADLKGVPIEDLKKARFYLNDEIANREVGQ